MTLSPPKPTPMRKSCKKESLALQGTLFYDCFAAGFMLEKSLARNQLFKVGLGLLEHLLSAVGGLREIGDKILCLEGHV